MELIRSLVYKENADQSNRFAKIELDSDLEEDYEITLNGTDNNGDVVYHNFIAIDNYFNQDEVDIVIDDITASIPSFTKVIWQVNPLTQMLKLTVTNGIVTVWISEKKLPIGEGTNQHGEETVASTVLRTNSRASVAAIASAKKDMAVFLTEKGREGLFVFDDTPLGLYVAADTAQGVYIAPASDPTGASGAWVRKFDGAYNFKWFGAISDPTIDTIPVWNAIRSLFSVIPNTNYYDAYPGLYRPFPKLWIPMGHYGLFSSLEADGGSWNVECEKLGQNNGAYGVAFKVAPGVDGVVIQTYNTTGVNGGKTSRASTYGGQGSHFKDMFLYTTAAGGYPAACGWYVRAQCTLDNCGAFNFPSHGCIVAATAGAGGAAEGNANGAKIRDGYYKLNGGCGIRCVGADSNAVIIEGATLDDNSLFGIDDSSFLGTFPRGILAQTNGIIGSGPQYANNPRGTTCSDGTYRYYIYYDQHVLASTTAPTFGADNAVWKLIGPGVADFYNPLWVNGLTWVCGGAAVVSQPTAQTTFRDCYAEGDNAPAQMIASGCWDGGLAGCLVFGALIQQSSGSGRMTSGSSLGAQTYSRENGQVVASLGSSAMAGADTRISGFKSTTWDNVNGEHRLTYNSFYKDVLYGRETGGIYMYRVTTDQTVFNPGRSATVPKAMIFPALFVGTDNAARQITAMAAAPVAGAWGEGDVVFNNGAVAGGKVGWVCVAAGTPGTWKAFGAIDV